MRRNLNAERWRSAGELMHVEARHFVAGLVVHEGRCVHAAPVLKWALGRPWPWLEGYLRGRGYVVTPLAAAAARARP